MKITQWLENHPKIEQVYYPFASSFPQYELAKKQMRGAGGLFSVAIKTDDISKIEAFYSRLKRFLFAVSWGGHESLVLPIAGLYNIPGRPNPSASWNMVRFYIGLEEADLLIKDLEQAMEVL